MKSPPEHQDPRLVLGDWMEKGSGFVTKIMADKKQPVDALEDVWAFAFWWTWQEMQARKVPNVFANRTLARRWVGRFARWACARIDWSLLLLHKECPDSAHADAGIAKAAFAGAQWAKGQPQHEAVLEIQRNWSALSRAAQHAFERWLSNPKPAAWKHPYLDAWLICIWPIVEEYRWRYQDVWLVADKKFDTSSGPPFESADLFANHCKNVLRLRTFNPVGGAPLKSDDGTLPPLGDLALEIPAELPGNLLRQRTGQ